MHYFKKLNENYYIYIILIFVLIPINFLPQLFDGILITYAFESGNTKILFENMYYDVARPFHSYYINLIFTFAKHTLIPLELLLDNLIIFFFILFSIEIKKYSKIFFGLDNKWSNLAALFTVIFPVWHVLVDFDIGLYLVSIYFLFFGFRKFISKKKKEVFIGFIFIILSFNVEANLSFVIGLSFIYLIIDRINNVNNFSFTKLFFLILTSFSYYIIRDLYFQTAGFVGSIGSESINRVSLDIINSNMTITKLTDNVLNFSSFFLLHIWVPIIFFLHLLLKNNKFELVKIIHFKYTNNYFLLILLSGFAIFPYLILNKSTSILDLGDYYQRNAFLLAPIFGFFFSIMFRDIAKINHIKNNVNLNFYLIIFIFINLLILNYGNYRKIESYLIRDNLTQEFKNIGNIPRGNVQFIGKNIPHDFRIYELNYLLYKAYGTTGWWSTPFYKKEISKPSNELIKNKKELTFKIAGEYQYVCDTYIYLKNDLTKYQRLKKFYVLNHKKYYNIKKILKKC